MSNKGTKRTSYYELSIGELPRRVTRYEKKSQRRNELTQALLLLTVMFGIAVGTATNNISMVEAKEEMLSPYVKPFENVYVDDFAREVQIEDSRNEKLSSPSQQAYSQIVKDVFGDKSDEALKIMQCESGGRPENVGDTHIMTFDSKNDEMVGDSIGLFQVRTGGKEKNGKVWNRARANGMTADEFRTYLKNPENNIRYAKDIYDNAGSWSPWFNCMNKVLSK